MKAVLSYCSAVVLLRRLLPMVAMSSHRSQVSGRITCSTRAPHAP
jgi:hypothetical protein